ncbi:ATP-grasp domain-containing protein [Streptosporangium soli]|nr:hypothetical protein [Streptosporangium sp. KLBMP 9127]
MRNNRILMVMPYRQHVRKAVAEGLEIYSIWDPTQQSGDHLEDVARLSEELTLTGSGDVAVLRRLVYETAVRKDVAHIFHLGRPATQLAVCEEARALGLSPHPAGSLRRINDTIEMRRLLAEVGLPCVRSVEEFLRGPAYSVETLTVEGRHHVAGIWGKTAPLDLAENLRSLPGPGRAAITDLVTAFLDATGYRFGPAHTEVILTGDGPLMVESQARLGDARVLATIESVTGLDMEAALFRTMAGRPLDFPAVERLPLLT